jgi:hypothetical protein
MKHLMIYDNFNKRLAFHITQRRNLKSILKNGLIPSIPADFNTDEFKGVYLFKTKSDAENALYNWLGERIEEWEEENDKEYDEVCLTVDISGLESNLIDSVEYEWTCTKKILPSRILSINECTQEFFNN